MKLIRLLGLLALLTLLPVVAHAQYIIRATGTNTCDITGYTGAPSQPIGVLNIPNVINGLTVTYISFNAFYYCVNLTSVTIPNSVTCMGSSPFGGCTSLTNISVNSGNPVYSSVDGVMFNQNQSTLISCPAGRTGNYTIPNSVANIRDDAFYNCLSLTNVVIPASVTNIGTGAFCNCLSLINIVIPASVTSIGFQGFWQCRSLTSVAIPNSVASIGDDAFYCASLTNISVNSGNLFFFSTNGILFNANLTTLIRYPAAKTNGNYTIPSSVNNLSGASFDSCTYLTSVTIPNSVTNIGTGAFSECANLPSVTIPNSVTSIGEDAFCLCTSLTNLTIGSSVSNIGEAAFDSCAITSITIPGSVTNLGKNAFSACYNLSTIWFFGNAPSLSNTNNFLGGRPISATAYYLPGTTGWGSSFDGLPTILVPYAFTNTGGLLSITGCSDTGRVVTIPSLIFGLPVSSLRDGAFSGCTNLTSVTIPNSVTNIGNAFEYCSKLTNVTIGANVASIGSSGGPGAFYNCTSLSTITIPSCVTNLGDYLFNGCTNLTTIYFEGNAPKSGVAIFYFAANVTVYYLPNTTNRISTFGGRPTILWNPQIQYNATFGIHTNCFGFTITNAGSPTVIVEACTNLTTPVWVPMSTNKLTGGTSYFSDTHWTNYASRFYRFRAP